MPARKKIPSHSRKHIHEPATLGERVADAIAAGMGSWRFIIIQSVVVFLWIVINGLGFILRWDPYPFILLNLAFSTQAAYTGPILQMTSNRSASRDRKRDDHEAEEVAELFKINQSQLEILRELKELRDERSSVRSTSH